MERVCAACDHPVEGYRYDCESCGAACPPPHLPGQRRAAIVVAPRLMRLSDAAAREPTIALGGAFDRAFPEGLYLGDAVCLSGAPGTGKSTLAILVAVHVGAAYGEGAAVLTVSESNPLMTTRLARTAGLELGALERVFITPVQRWTAVTAIVRTYRPKVLVVDSGSDLSTRDRDDRRGWDNARKAARSTGTLLVILVHVNGDGQIKGGTELPHLCDVHVHLTQKELRVRKARGAYVEAVPSDRALVEPGVRQVDIK